VLPYPRTAKALFAWQEHDLPRRADAVTVASRTLQTQVWGAGVPPARVFYLPNGISLTDKPVRASDAPPTSARTILLYTRFWELDVREVVATLIAVHQQQPAARLLVVGKGERCEEDHLLQLAQRAGVAAAIDYRGWLEPAHLPAVFAEADVALVPMTDTLINRARCSAKLLELMAAGLPVVATRIGQNPEYIQHGVSGLLVPPGDPAALAQALLTLLNDDELRQQFVAAGHRALTDYTWQRLAHTAERAYRYALYR
jgi:glycosyltransferase involved in cell wall biosynthesis